MAHPEDRDRILNEWHAFMASTETTWIFEYRLVRGDAEPERRGAALRGQGAVVGALEVKGPHRVVVLAGGQIVAEGAPGTLAVRDSTSAWVRYRLPEGVRPPDGLGGPAGSDGMVEVHVGHPTSDLYRLLRWAMERGIDLEGLEVKRPTLEDVYLDLTAPKKDEPA
jgi:hypothetical protein